MAGETKKATKPKQPGDAVEKKVSGKTPVKCMICGLTKKEGLVNHSH